MLDLVLHSSENRKPRHRVRASVRRIAGSDLVTLRFEVEGAASVLWPDQNQSEEGSENCLGRRRDGLWKETCLECFVAAPSSLMPSYYEWNFSPNGDWAAYRFDRYREGMKKFDISSPTIVRTSVGDRARFEIDFALPDDFGAETSCATLALSITAVILEKGENAGAPFYWALAHKGEKPDFHLRESFTLEVEC